MELVKKLNISRLYILKRIICKFLIVCFANRFVGGLLPSFIKYHIFDVEKIFDIFGCPREIENIILINYLLKAKKFDFYLDVGSNYGQFADSINFSNKLCVEANPKLAKYSKKNYNLNVINAAFVPNVCKNTAIYFEINSCNSGLSRIVKSPNKNTIKVDYLDMDLLVKSGRVDIAAFNFVKIDVEGLELELASSIMRRLAPERTVICFEVLNFEFYDYIEDNFQNHTPFEIRFRYQGCSDKNYKSLLSILNVFLHGEDDLILRKISRDYLRDFYSLVFLIPKSFEPFLNKSYHEINHNW